MGRLLPIWFWVVVFSLSIICMLYLGFNPTQITKWWAYLLAYNLGFSLLAILLIVRNIRYLKQQESSGVLGSKLTTSFIKMVPLIAILPLVSFYVFSFNNIQGTIADIRIFAEELQKERQDKLDRLASDLGEIKLAEYQEKTQSLLNIILQNNRYEAGDNGYLSTMQSLVQYLVDIDLACDIELYNARNELIVAARNSELCPSTFVRSAKFAHLSLYESKEIPKRLFFKSQAVNYRGNTIGLRVVSVYVLEPEVDFFLEKLDRSRKSQLSIELNLSPLRNAFLIDMSSTLLLSILAILMIVFKMINTLMVPLSHLSQATKKVAGGDYDVFIAQHSSGDAKILIDLFNHMAKQVKSAQHDLETQRIYLETILQYSYGVMALNEYYQIRLLNSEMEKILQVQDLSLFYGQDYLVITQQYPSLLPLTQLIKQHFDSQQSPWADTIEIMLKNQMILLSCQGAVLETKDKVVLGYVVVLKDITQLRDAQDKAAWGAVAMKMAHEVKNPLSPIQLSADRLRNKLLPKLSKEDASTLDKTTHTITEQVKSIDAMISAFAQYAKTPVLHKTRQLLSDVITQAVRLYDSQKNVAIKLYPLKDEPPLPLDENSMRRVFINLIKNAIEAITHDKKYIDIRLSTLKDSQQLAVVLEDNGPGFSDHIKDKIFKPHISTKKKGGGLGMAIVKSILNEHYAEIILANRFSGDKIAGARITINFKLNSQ